MSWSRRFDEPIILPDGKKLLTLKDAIAWLAKELNPFSISPIMVRQTSAGSLPLSAIARSPSRLRALATRRLFRPYHTVAVDRSTTATPSAVRETMP